jgi:hypothetical protein
VKIIQGLLEIVSNSGMAIFTWWILEKFVDNDGH